LALDPRTPVLVGAGVARQQLEDPLDALPALDLMALAAERAGEDAAAPQLLTAIGAVLVPRGTGRDPDPGRVLSARFGASGARSVVAEIGVLQQTLFTRACTDIRDGALEVALVCGGEARHRDQRARILGVELPPPDDGGPGSPDEVLAPAAEILPRPEIDAGLISAPLQYSMIETAIRAARGETVAANARATAELWAGFSAVAAANPDAWRRDQVSVADLELPSERNPMLAAPYTKWHCSQWNVDQAAALLLCSAEAAARFGVPRDRWVFPLAAAESNHMVPVSRRDALHASPAVFVVGEHLAARAGIDLAAVAHVDLYSCFPAAVRVQAEELGVPADRTLTVTGGMTFGGGPLNNAVLQATAKLVEGLRADPGATGLVTSISGMITKHGGSLWSTEPPARGFTADDVSEEVARRTVALDLVADHDGPAVVAGCTVAHERGAPVSAHVVATTPDGRRVAARCDDPDVARAMTTDEWVGRDVRVRGATFRA
jgi:acetyl-CoA C-acetyltransferase